MHEGQYKHIENQSIGVLIFGPIQKNSKNYAHGKDLLCFLRDHADALHSTATRCKGHHCAAE
jgi:hypothetical protein